MLHVFGCRPVSRVLRIPVAVLVAAHLAACSNIVEWREEVQLNDNRVIVVVQKRRCEGGDYTAKTGATCIARDAWLHITLPEISPSEIVWHEALNPMVLNIDKGRLYVVGFPPHTLEFRAYGATNPPYFGFVWESGTWKRISFAEIPTSIYDTNMLIESIPGTRTRLMTLQHKKGPEENGTLTKPAPLHRVDPSFKMSPY